ncbi:hypothetical protein DVA67_028120 [Solirubrobacter sp. CPCC 204708]|uniref:Uncharacterized protein n=1 Tax=Solirubrobacter deserti TaxID=2282478 RepID=A0ABT4RS51_9ACTN|nr:hypothetical protein [Solirubrobacter deserti]MBE2319864.1 hypothetical protein [Solirubrobacter deserti]MDA0141397.1 hypothetical protein [Solirubrobacter deserti]
MRLKGFAGLAGVLGVLAIGAPTAHAHPCAETWSLSTATFLSANNSSIGWGGSLPTMNNDADCAPVEGSKVAASVAMTGADAAADPVEEAVASFEYTPNMTPLGYSKRVPPLHTGTSLADINSDIAFKGNLAFQGHWSGFRVIDISDPKNPTQLYNTEACRHTAGQGDVIVHGNILVRTWDSGATGSQAGATCMDEPVNDPGLTGFQGLHIWNIADPANPVYVRKVRMATTGNGAGVPNGCGAHTATGVPDDARGYFYVYVGGSENNCPGMDIVRIKLDDPSDAVFLRRAVANRQCHDNNVIMGQLNMAMCAGGNGFSVFKWDPSKPADEAGTPESPGGIANPTLMYSRQVPEIGNGPAHSGSFTYDGKVLIFGWEPGGGTNPRCQADLPTSPNDNLLFFFDPATGTELGRMTHTRPQSAIENCTWHNFNVVPTYKGYYAVSGNYQKGISVIDFTNPAAATEVAYADPKPFSTHFQPTAGDWSTHFYNGKIYQSDIRRGLITWDLDHDLMRRVRTPDLSNPQTQTASFAQDLDGPTITSANEGQGYKKGTMVAVQFACADGDSGVESCTADAENLDTGTVGTKSFRVTARDKAGNVTTKDVTYLVNSADFPHTVGGGVPATLSLTLAGPTQFPPFVAGTAQEYTTTSEANVISTAGDAALTVADPGHMTNGAFSLAAPLQVSFSKAAWTAPVSNDKVTVTFKQAVGANEPLRTGTYSKTLTFTLSTSTP